MKKFLLILALLCFAQAPAWGLDTVDVSVDTLADGTTGAGWSYDATNKIYTVTGDVTITGSTTTNRIVVANNATAARLTCGTR